jgi:hypothetical protein
MGKRQFTQAETDAGTVKQTMCHRRLLYKQSVYVKHFTLITKFEMRRGAAIRDQHGQKY